MRHVNPQQPSEVAAFVERFASQLTDAGMQRMASRVFACLLVSDDGALNAAELGQRLDVSPAAISGAVRYLSRVHMLTRERQPGSRREIYRLRPNVWYETTLNREAMLTQWQTTLIDGAQVAGEDSPAGRRLTEAADFMAFLSEETAGILKRWQQRQRG